MVASLAGGLAGLGGLVFAARRGAGTRASTRDWPVNFAHRGASGLAPENTLEAFRIGVEAGARGLELDAHMTLDGEVVVLHDPTVDRTTDGSGAVAEMPLADLRRLDAGYRFSLDGGSSYPYRGRGLRIPTLAEVYDEFPGAFLNIEIKEARPGIEEAVLRVIRDAGARGRTLVVSNRHGVVRRFRRLAGDDVSTGASRREITEFYLWSRSRLEGLRRPAYDALQVPVEHRGIPLITPRFIQAAHARGVRVDAWTINDPAEMRRLLELGVDVIMTDRPDLLARVLDEGGTYAKITSTAEAAPKSE